MTRSVLALFLGLVLWVLVASAVSPVLRVAFEGYPVAERRMTFTPGMMIARLAFGALASVIAGAVTKAVAPSSASVSWLLGAILLVMFIPFHAQLWAKFPAWYHLVFLGVARTTGRTRCGARSKPFAHCAE